MYVEEVDETRVEMEVLTQERTKPFGGDGTKEQEILENAIKLLLLVADAPKTLEEVGETVAEEIAEIICEEMEDEYDISRILQEGDVRISVQPNNLQGKVDLKYNYFFRNGQLMFVELGKGTLWVNKEFIQATLKEE